MYINRLYIWFTILQKGTENKQFFWFFFLVKTNILKSSEKDQNVKKRKKRQKKKKRSSHLWSRINEHHFSFFLSPMRLNLLWICEKCCFIISVFFFARIYRQTKKKKIRNFMIKFNAVIIMIIFQINIHLICILKMVG